MTFSTLHFIIMSLPYSTLIKCQPTNIKLFFHKINKRVGVNIFYFNIKIDEIIMLKIKNNLIIRPQ